MNTPKFSIVIPAYNQAEYLPEAIQSVLDQTYTSFEIIVVNDASPDNTSEVVKQFTDPRVKLIVHEKNKGLPGARNTGMRAASGDDIALLDADDLFHPDKLAVHADYLEQHPEISVTYNARFELNYSEKTIRELVRPPLTVGLMDFVHGFPFTPSDMVIRRRVAERVGYFDEGYRCGGEDLEYPCRLALSGCQFGSVDRALNYRRHQSGKVRKNLPCRLEDVKKALAMVHNHPQCPQDIHQLGDTPITEHLMVLVYQAFIQEWTELGQTYLLDLIKTNPNVLQGVPCPLVSYFINDSTADESQNHEAILRLLFSQLPALPVDISGQLQPGIGEGYLIKGIRAAIWGREDAAHKHFSKASEVKAQITNNRFSKIIQQLNSYAIEMGDQAMQVALERLLSHLKHLCTPVQLRWFSSQLAIVRGFENYRRHQYHQVIRNVSQAIRSDPKNMLNRGLVSIFVRSLLHP